LALLPGTRLGAYEVTAQIGAGGMGEVYRATDNKLKRQVAIKILPARLAADRDRLARFQREAEVLASLNHPNIAAIHGLEESASVSALVMELVEGDNLAERLARGAIPIDEALSIARQFADALEAAHAQGIIHRDFKPANVKVRPDGTVKVLDFGLAKALDPAFTDGVPAAQAELAESPTITSPAMTQAGVILGTAAYMSPEQAKGRVVDKRTDVWAFGAVLYEMLTARRAFEGEDVSETVAHVLMKEPDWSALPATVPPAVETVLRRCLQKDRKQRMRDIGDVSLALDGAFHTVAPQTTSLTSSRSRGGLAWGLAIVFGLALAGLAFVHMREAPAELRRTHLSVPLSATASLGSFAFSPDGRSVVMGYEGGYGIRSLESGETRMLGGLTSGGLVARTPFFSADNRNIAFFGDRKLKTAAASGGPPRTLCEEVGLGGGGTWNRAGEIVFATEAGALLRVSAEGGPCTELTKPEQGLRRTIPVFLPDGEHFLYVASSLDEARRGVFVASLGDPIGRRLLADQSSAIFVPNGPGANQGHLLFVREQALMAAAFDASSRQLSGEPVTVARPVSFTNATPQIAAFADANGTLMYLANSRPDRQLVWYDRSGKELVRAGVVGQASGVSLAPDGKRVVFRRTDAQALTSLWVQDLERDHEIRLTTPPLSPGAAVLSPDGQRAAFVASGRAMHIRSVTGGSEEVLLPAGTNARATSDWTRDDRWLVYTEIDPKTGADIWLLTNPSRPSADRKPTAWLRTPSLESQGQISPDGRWLAYCSDESGRLQVYLRPFAGAAPAPDIKWPASAFSGREPRWRADSKELFWVESVAGTTRSKLMAAPIGRAPNPVGVPRALFEFETVIIVPQGNQFSYAPSADGQRFVINVLATDARPSLDVILNWGRTQSAR
jgi:Tol biopolymer transport system component